MSTVSVPNSAGPNGTENAFTVINATTIDYLGIRYENVSDIAFPDGSHKTPAQILQDAGGETIEQSELKACVKVEAIDPDANGRQMFSVYSSNSRQTGKNVSSSVPGGVWVEVFDFLGTTTTNPILALWAKLLNTENFAGLYNPAWLGFKINYGVSEQRSYVLTQFNNFAEESIPSPPVNIDVTVMHGAKLSGVFRPPAPLQTAAGEAHYTPILNFRVYRTNLTSSGQFIYQRVPGDAVGVAGLHAPPPSQATGSPFPGAVYVSFPRPWAGAGNPTQFDFAWEFNDIAEADTLLEELPSLDWDAPPPRKLKGLTALRNGMMAAYSDNLVYFCEPYRPFAFPQKYIKALPANVVGMRADENSLVVITDGEPYIFNGSHPANVTYERLQNVQAGIKPAAINGFVNPTRALCRTPAGVVYASGEGLVLISGGRAQPLLRDLMTREEWRLRYSAAFDSLHLAYYDGQLLAYSATGDGFIVNLGAEPNLVEYLPAVPPSADFVLPQTDMLHFVTGSSPSIISRFADQNFPRRACTYHTREVIVPKPATFGVLQLIGQGDVQATVFADGEAVLDQAAATLAGAHSIRLPAGFLARQWSVLLQLADDAIVSEAHLASTPSELAGV